jgi:hypothetical protein
MNFVSMKIKCVNPYRTGIQGLLHESLKDFKCGAIGIKINIFKDIFTIRGYFWADGYFNIGEHEQ